MNVHIANYEPDRIGGGWTAARYLYEGLGSVAYAEADTYLICGPTMVSRNEVAQAKLDNKKIILRLDNAVRDSRNRGTGMSRIRDFCELADAVIYQSQWAKDFLMPFTHTDGPVILNGVDTKRFNSQDRTAPDDSYLFARSSRDEGKGWVMAWYWFVNNPGQIEIAGKFSSDNLDWGFDFYNEERWKFSGFIQDMVPIYKRNKYFLYTYLNDACSNTLLEARASGCEIVDVYGMLQTGGAPEIMACQDISVDRMIREYQEVIK
jgi:glycosyltransferase involved in cell wall biosynthesis